MKQSNNTIGRRAFFPVAGALALAALEVASFSGCNSSSENSARDTPEDKNKETPSSSTNSKQNHKAKQRALTPDQVVAAVLKLPPAIGEAVIVVEAKNPKYVIANIPMSHTVGSQPNLQSRNTSVIRIQSDVEKAALFLKRGLGLSGFFHDGITSEKLREFNQLDTLFRQKQKQYGKDPASALALFRQRLESQTAISNTPQLRQQLQAVTKEHETMVFVQQTMEFYRIHGAMWRLRESNQLRAYDTESVSLFNHSAQVTDLIQASNVPQSQRAAMRELSKLGIQTNADAEKYIY